LGVTDNDQLELAVQHVDLEPSDHLVVYSDGYIEVKDKFDQMLGSARLVDAVMDEPCEAGLYGTLVGLLRDFRAGADRSDDVALMVISAEIGEDDAASNAAPALFSKDPVDWRYTMELGANALRKWDPLPSLLQAVSRRITPSASSDWGTWILAKLRLNSSTAGRPRI
jgi:hypothetical protein